MYLHLFKTDFVERDEPAVSDSDSEASPIHFDHESALHRRSLIWLALFVMEVNIYKLLATL